MPHGSTSSRTNGAPASRVRESRGAEPRLRDRLLSSHQMWGALRRRYTNDLRRVHDRLRTLTVPGRDETKARWRARWAMLRRAGAKTALYQGIWRSLRPIVTWHTLVFFERDLADDIPPMR